MSGIWKFFETICQRSMVMGAVVPASERWRVYLQAVATPAFAAVVMLVISTEPDPWHWRVFLGWALLGAAVFSMPVVVLMLYGHHFRERVDPS